MLTDMLREGSQQLWLDENHRHAVERGVVSKYRDQGMRAYRSENRYWRALFGLTFWPLLFGEGAQNANEFDRRPRCLVHDDFYASQAEAIEGVLARLDTRERWLAHATKVAASAYGEPNGMFRWSEHLLTRVARLLEAFSVPSLHTVLRQMSRHYALFRDGFPDLLVMDEATSALDTLTEKGRAE